MKLEPRPGFDWAAVSWGEPDEPPTETCSYCVAPLGDPDEPDYEVPLILWTRAGGCARFCINCQRQWWGLSDKAEGEE